MTIQLAKKINAKIICADSRIIYKNFDIVSAKPTVEERENIVHYLIDIIEPYQEFSAGDFVKLAKEIINNIDENIIISGGTWFYIKSLLDNKALIECPKNQKLRDELNLLDNNILWEKLNSLDSKRASLIHPNNKDKIIRSIEMCLYLNQPVSEMKREDNFNYEAKWFMPEMERDELYQRINQRVDLMINQGLFEEWEKNNKLYPNNEIMKNTIGYSEFFEYEYKEAIEKIKQHTRNFAKRQLTYFKSAKHIIKINSLNDILNEI